MHPSVMKTIIGYSATNVHAAGPTIATYAAVDDGGIGNRFVGNSR